ncbi:unnamed protein product [Lathyrus sativus]|nr:unnamed protein product [Lathyrus sativus]
MDGQDLSPLVLNGSRPSICFPLGIALLLFTFFILSGIFSCCYHWEKYRRFHQSISAHEAAQSHTHTESEPFKFIPQFSELEMEETEKSITVLMPGDEVPKFIAMPCPCQPPRPEGIVVDLEQP